MPQLPACNTCRGHHACTPTIGCPCSSLTAALRSSTALKSTFAAVMCRDRQAGVVNMSSRDAALAEQVPATVPVQQQSATPAPEATVAGVETSPDAPKPMDALPEAGPTEHPTTSAPEEVSGTVLTGKFSPHIAGCKLLPICTVQAAHNQLCRRPRADRRCQQSATHEHNHHRCATPVLVASARAFYTSQLPSGSLPLLPTRALVHQQSRRAIQQAQVPAPQPWRALLQLPNSGPLQAPASFKTLLPPIR
jgi:hypothetical protein